MDSVKCVSFTGLEWCFCRFKTTLFITSNLTFALFFYHNAAKAEYKVILTTEWVVVSSEETPPVTMGGVGTEESA